MVKKFLGNMKEVTGKERGVKKNPLTAGMMRTRAKAAEAGKSAARILTSTSKPAEQGEMDVALQTRDLKESKTPAAAIAKPMIPEKQPEKIYRVVVVKDETK